MSNFLILIGGPGLFKSCDQKHDKTWINYFYPIQVAAEEKLLNRGESRVHWIVYEPAYNRRWLEDSEVTLLEGAFELASGRNLHKVREQHAIKVKKSGAKNYLDHIKRTAKEHNITYKGINTPNEFWRYIESFPARSISRVWFSGHATTKGLILELTHDAQCIANWSDKSTLLVSSIDRNKNLANRFIVDNKKPSKFYGCNTRLFAETFHTVFGLATEGANSSITFKGIFGERKKILERLETTPTPQGRPQWTKYPTEP
ncbi:MAG: hypothetical protein VYA55_07925 [Pseudomonadota bacterium]|nr:hypothetical protein [Pseudomonadota bacterium]